jgi:hypothetical protein
LDRRNRAPPSTHDGQTAEHASAPLGVEPVSETPTQFEAFAKRYVTRNGELLKAANFEAI